MSRWRTGAAALMILTVPAVTACGSGQMSDPARPNPVRSEIAHNPTPAPSRVDPAVVPVPERLRIPAIEVDTAVVQLGLNRDRTVEVPGDPDEAGWFDLGPAPGELGSAVVLGHVDSTRGPAVFHRLSALRPGNRVEVRLSDGAVADFTVVRVVTYPNREFPGRRVYAGNPHRRTLALVTCGGAYDPDAGGYQSNVVVYTKLLPTQHHR